MQLAHNCSFGKWLCGSQLVAVVSNSSVYWLLSILISTTATGVYAACWTVVLLANPFILGLGNVLQPKTSQAFAAGGKGELVRLVRNVTLVLGAFLMVFGLTVFLAGEQIVAWLYDDPAFANQGHTITVLTFSMIVAALGMGYGHGLKAMERPQWSFAASLLDLTVMLLTAAPLAWSFGMVGGAYCLLCGSIAGTATRYVAFTLLAGASIEVK
jgi:O-antigen/teichoic acid export membrane protein